MAESKSVAEKKDQVPAEYDGYADYAGAGFENQTSDDYAIPFLKVLEALSLELEDNDGFKPGMIINTVTGEVFPGKDGIVFIPATTQHVYVEWKPRDAGGGFVGVHEPQSELVRNCVANQEFGEFRTPDGNDLIETFYVYGIFIGKDDTPQEAVLSFSSARIKKYKAWMTKAKTIQIQLGDGRRIPAPLFSHRYRLTTVPETSPKGKFNNWNIMFDGDNAVASRLLPNDPLFQSAVGIKTMIEQGKARAAYESQNGPDAAGDGGASGGKPAF